MSMHCQPPKPAPPPPAVFSKVSAKECDSQESPTAVELGLCDEALCSLAAHLDMWSFAPDTDWSKCYVEPNGDPSQCRLKCPGAKKALAIGGAAGGAGGQPKGCDGSAGPPGCKGKCCFRLGGEYKCSDYDEGACYGLAEVWTGSARNKQYVYSDITYDCKPKGCSQ